MNKYLEDVKKFMTMTGQVMHTSQNVIDEEMNDLRYNLIAEEFDEYIEGVYEENKVAVLDALLDLQYVLSGAILAHGFADVFDEAFDEVHRSNMTKCCSESDAFVSVAALNVAGTKCHFIENPLGDGTFIILRDSDGKLLKPINYSPADLERFIK